MTAHREHAGPQGLGPAPGSRDAGPASSARLRITGIRLRDFRGTKALALDLTYLDGSAVDVAVLWGGSGAGKSTVLEAVELAMQTYVLPESEPAVSRRAVQQSARPRHFIRFGARECLVEVELRVSRDDGPPLEFACELTVDAEALSFFTLAPATLRWVRPEDAVDHGAPHAALRAAGVAWPPHRRVVRLSCGSGAELFDWTGPLLDEAYRQARYCGRERIGELPQLATLSQFWQRFQRGRPRVLDIIPIHAPGDESATSLPAALESPGLFIVRDADRPAPGDTAELLRAWPEASSSPAPMGIPLACLSRGELSLLRIGAHLLLRHRPPDLVLLEDPEVHLPPAWQAQLLPALRSCLPTTQILVATQSPTLATAALDYERFPLPEA